MINVDEKMFAAAVGFPNETVVMQNDHERRAARAVTGATACQSAKQALLNAAHWTGDAYREGFEAGKLAERGEWQARIARVFGL